MVGLDPSTHTAVQQHTLLAYSAVWRKLTLFLTDIHVALGGEGGDRSRVARAVTVRVPHVVGVHRLQSVGFFVPGEVAAAGRATRHHAWMAMFLSAFYNLRAARAPATAATAGRAPR